MRSVSVTVLSLMTLIKTGVNPACWRVARAGPRATLTRDSGFRETTRRTCGSSSCWSFLASRSLAAAFRPTAVPTGNGEPRYSNASTSRLTLAAKGWPSTSTVSMLWAQAAGRTRPANTSAPPNCFRLWMHMYHLSFRVSQCVGILQGNRPLAPRPPENTGPPEARQQLARGPQTLRSDWASLRGNLFGRDVGAVVENGSGTLRPWCDIATNELQSAWHQGQ